VIDDVLSQAEDNLRVIRESMQRAKGLTNFGGVSGIFAGFLAIIGAFAQRIYVMSLPADARSQGFFLCWSLMIAFAVVFDYWNLSRRSRDVNRSLATRIVRHNAKLALPSILLGVLLTIAFVHEGRMNLVYPYWMLVYGCAVLAVAQGAAKELVWLGRGFLAFGIVVLLLQTFGSQHLRDAQIGLAAMLPSFGLLNIVYGISVGRRDGW